MKVLLDNCVHQGLAELLVGHSVVHAKELGWHRLSNGALLSAAEGDGFLVIVTVDKNMRHQQSFSGRQLSLITLDGNGIDIWSLAPLVETASRRTGCWNRPGDQAGDLGG